MTGKNKKTECSAKQPGHPSGSLREEKRIARVQYLSGCAILADLEAANYSFQIVDRGWMGIYLTDKEVEIPKEEERKLLFSDVDLLSYCNEPRSHREMELSEVKEFFEFVEITEMAQENVVNCTYPDMQKTTSIMCYNTIKKKENHEKEIEL